MTDEKQEPRRGRVLVGIHLGDRSYSGGLIWGLGFTFVGAILLLDNMGLISIHSIWRFWPLLLVLAGAANLSRRENRFWGIILIIAGVVFQLNQLGLAHFGWSVLWPVLLICIGVMIMWGSLEAKKDNPSAPVSGDPRNTLNETVVFGGIEQRVTTKNFQGGQITAVFGGIELDFRESNMDADDATLEVNAIFGGAEIRVPYSWRVAYRGTPLFGGITDKSEIRDQLAGEGSKPKVLHITGAAIFGGIEIKN